jgi:hypothetical protein
VANKLDPRHTTRAFYQYIFAVDPSVFGVEHDVCCAALEAEGVPAEVGYAAMHHYDLFQPRSSRLAVPNAFPERFDFSRMDFPVAERACEHEAVWLDESAFRAGPGGIDDAVAAIRKIQRYAGELAKAAEELRSQYGK